MRRLSRRARPVGPGVGGSREEQDGADFSDLPERQVLEVLLNEPGLFADIAESIDPAQFARRDLRAIAARVWSLGASGRLSLEAVLADPQLSQYGSLVTDLLTAGERRGNHERTLAAAAACLEYRAQQIQQKELRSKDLDPETLRKLTERLKRPDLRRRPRIT